MRPSPAQCRLSLTPNHKIGVIFTCITGRYDELKNHAYIDARWDYVCFTDDISCQSAANSNWQIRPLAFDRLDNIRNQKWHKLHPHVLFPEYEQSIWIDGNINVLNQGFFDDIDRARAENRELSIAPHPQRNCIYDEMQACLEIGKDHAAVMRRQIQLLRKAGFPKKQGLFENNIIFRLHHRPLVKKIMTEWWWWIENHSRRDQLSLVYVLWKNGVTIAPLANVTYRTGDKVEFVYGANHITIEEVIALKNKQEGRPSFPQRLRNLFGRARFWRRP